MRARYLEKPVLDLVMGAQIGDFSGTSLFEAFNSDWTLDSRADRMGIRLLGPQLVYQGAPMISEGFRWVRCRCRRTGSQSYCSMTGRPLVGIRGWGR
ncbi:hypothetical protein PspTeo4_25648 [Pseudomonas sp. Teo4]|nr:hypothetical protein [Pseudomonas sp. Teo4]